VTVSQVIFVNKRAGERSRETRVGEGVDEKKKKISPKSQRKEPYGCRDGQERKYRETTTKRRKMDRWSGQPA